MSRRRTAGIAAGIAMGFALGATLTLAIQGWANLPDPGSSAEPPAVPATEPQPPEAFLVWTSGGMPDGFRAAVERLDGIQRSVVVASDNTWLDRSWSEQGEVVDDPKPGFAIPLEVAAVDPDGFAPFLPPADRSDALALADGQGILGESSARLRGLGPGAVLRFGDVRIEVAAILPDELVGAHELMVSREVGRSIGVTHDRYALVVPEHARSARAVERLLDPILPADPPSKVRAPGDTPYFRQGDAVLPRSGSSCCSASSQARPEPGNPGFLDARPGVGEAEHRHAARPAARDGDLQRVAVPAAPRCRPRADRPWLAGHDPLVLGLLLAPAHQPDPERGPVAPLLGHRGRPERPAGQPVRADARTRTRGWSTVFERWGFIWGGTFIVPTGCTSSTAANPPATDARSDREMREGSSEHAQSALARYPAAGATGSEHASRGKRAWVSAPFAVARRRPGHRTPAPSPSANDVR